MLKDALGKIHHIAETLDDNDPDKLEMLNTEADYKGLMEWALRKRNESLILADGTKQLAADYGARAKRYNARAEKFKEICEVIMNSAGEEKYEGSLGTVYFSKKPQALLVGDEEKIPDKYFETVKKLNKTALVNALKNGDVVEGATLDNGGLTLNIRRK